MITDGREKGTLTKRFAELRKRHQGRALVTIAVISTLAFIFAQFYSVVWEWVFKIGLIQWFTLLIVLDVALSIHRYRDLETTLVAKNQDETMPRLIEAVPYCRGDSADLLEYAGTTTLTLIRAIQREGVGMRMLIKHPDTVTGLQRERTLGTLEIILESIFESHRGELEIRCYRMPFNLRGRRLGKRLLELGWLTTDAKRQTAYGYANPSVIVDLSTKRNDYLLEFFNRTFSDLWDAPDTEDARAVLNRSKSASKKAAT